MFDQNIYNTYFNAAYQILQQNAGYFGQQFCNEFVAAHNMQPGNRFSEKSVVKLYENVSNYIHSTTGSMRFDDSTLFNVMGGYIKHIFAEWQQAQQRGQSMGFGNRGFGNSGGFSSGGFGSSSGFGNGFGSPKPTAGSHFADTSVQSQPTSGFSSTPTQVQTTQAPVEIKIVNTFSSNPLDAFENQTLEFVSNTESPTWGRVNPHDTSIAIMDHHSIVSKDNKVAIQAYDAMNMTYFDNPMDVARDFFRVAPDQFIADHFVFRIFYNHIERLDIPTVDFLEARKKFTDDIQSGRSGSVYDIIIGILNNMMYAPRKALAEYLVIHINRALKLSFGMSEFPQLRISFSEIEDLEELLGTSFNHKLLEVPNAKNSILTIVNNAIQNALTTYSDVMFTEEDGRDIDVIRSSSVFPHSIENVYPSKDVIPSSGTPEAANFFAAMQGNELNHRTYVRSIRSVIVTNILGNNTLFKITDKPELIESQIPAILNTYILDYYKRLPNEALCRKYNTNMRAKTVDEYKDYQENSDKFALDRLSKIVDFDAPLLPVDQTVFAIQYKTSPYDYLTALDLCTVMDRPSGKAFTLLAKKKIKYLKVTD
jgi:hypothetical protein